MREPSRHLSTVSFPSHILLSYHIISRQVTKGTFTLLGTGEPLKPKEPPAGQEGGGGGSAASLVKSNLGSKSSSVKNISPPGSPSAASQNSDLLNGDPSSGAGGGAGGSAGAFMPLGTVAETCVVTDKVSSLSFSKDGGRFVVVTGKVVQVFCLASPQHGGQVGRTQLLVGHAAEVVTWSWDADERKVKLLDEWDMGYGRACASIHNRVHTYIDILQI